MTSPQLTDDRVWEQVWEETLDPLERYTVARQVWRGEVPTDRFEAGVAVEFARRWRRRAVSYAVLCLLWSGFWGALTYADVSATGRVSTWLAPVAAVLGLLAAAGYVVFRRRIAAVAAEPRRADVDVTGG